MSENMKASGIAWIGDIPESWSIKRVKYLATLKGRIGWQGLTSDEYTDEGPYLITGIDFENGKVNWDNCVHISRERWEEATEIQIQNGDLLITKDGTVGKVAIVSELNELASLNSGVLVIRTNSDFDRRFLFWVLQSEEFWVWFRLKNAGNSTIIHLYQNDFAEFCYTYPKTIEQTLIADFLDEQCEKIDNIATDIEKQIEILQKYKKSLITERTYSNSLDWVKTKIKYIGEIRGRIGFRGYTVEDTVDPDTEGCAVVLGGTNIMKDGTTNYEDLTFLSEMKYFESPEIMLIGGEILITKVGAGTGENSMYDGRFERATINPNIMLYLPKDNINSKFINYVLLSNRIKDDMKVESTKSGAQPAINQGYINNLEVIIPPYDKQTQIANYLDVQCSKIDAIIESKKEQLTKITQHKKSLIYEYVTGKKRVKGANSNGN